MKPTLVYRVHGRAADGTAFVSDGAILVRGDLVEPVASTEGLQTITADQIAGMLRTPPAALTKLGDLAPSRVAAGMFRTPDDVALAEKYVRILASLERPLVLGTTVPRGIVVVRDGSEVIGALMPVAMPPEVGTYLPPPAPGAERGRVEAFSAEARFGRVGLVGGHEALFELRALVGLAPDLLVHALVDADVRLDPDGMRRVVWMWPAGTPRPPQAAPPAPPPRVRWPSRVAFDGLFQNGLLGEFDGGTWARLLVKLLGRITDDVDEEEVFAALSAVYLVGGVEHTSGRRAGMEGIYLARDVRAEHEASVQAAVTEFAAVYGVEDVVVDDPLDVTSVFRGLGRAFEAAGRAERVYLVGDRKPFVVIRERIVSYGPFTTVLEHRPEPARPAVETSADAIFLSGFAQSILSTATRIVQVASLKVDESPEAPGFCVHVLERVFGERQEGSFFLVTNGLSARPLRATGPGGVVRFELATWSDRHDAELARTIAHIGRAIHEIAAPGSIPFRLGHTITTDSPAWMGWSRILLAGMIKPVQTPSGAVEVLRAVPISDAEDEILRQRDPMFGGQGFVTELENRDFRATLARWYEPIS